MTKFLVLSTVSSASMQVWLEKRLSNAHSTSIHSLIEQGDATLTATLSRWERVTKPRYKDSGSSITNVEDDRKGKGKSKDHGSLIGSRMTLGEKCG